jgi:hypothetical protein
MLIKCGLAMSVAVSLCATALGGNDYYFGNFEEDVQFNGQYILDRSAGTAGGYRGWYDWNGQYDPPDPLVTSALPSTEFGVTTGQYSMAWVPSGTGFHQGLTVNIQDLPAATKNSFFDAFFSNTHVAFNITWNNDEWFDAYQGSGWNGTNFSLVANYGGCDPGGVNCGGGAYSPQGFPDIDTGNPGDFRGHYDINNYPGVHTRVVQWDYSALKPAIQAQYDAGRLNANSGWLELMLETNAGNFAEGVTYYVDSWRLTDNIEDVVEDGDFNNDGFIDAADYVSWRKNGLPQDDYNLWRSNFGESSPGSGGLSSQGVPEPAAATLAALATCLLNLHRRRK